ncbi:MAG: glutathione S-transferase [Elusimicrobia bacterium]|nr:MAG: glutathione S-transferase [Elusimicrobiota bacterium]
MIELYAWNTSNGRKISILLEELGLTYNYHPINISEGDQFKPDFLKLNPNGKIPAIVDTEGPDGKPISVFESGAILIYLAEKTKSDLLPQDWRARTQVMEWLMFQMGGVGPQLGQALHFYKYAKEKVSYGIDRYMTEAQRLYKVMDTRVANKDYFAGDYSLADISIYPWIVRHNWLDIDWSKYPNLKRWYDRIGAREAVQRGLSALAVD